MKCLYTCALLLILLQNAFSQDAAWNQVPIPAAYTVSYITSGKNSEMYISTSQGIFVTTDVCKTWQQLSKADSICPWLWELVVTKQSYIIGKATNQSLYLSTNRGGVWQKITPPIGIYELVADTTGALWAKSSDGVYKSNDNGYNWKKIPISEPYFAQICISKQNDIYINSTQSIYVSTDGGETWIKNTHTDFLDQIALDDQGNLYIRVDSKGLYVSMDKAKTLEKRSSELFGFNNMVFDKKGNAFYCNDMTGVFKSTDSARTWQYCGNKKFARNLYIFKDSVYAAGSGLYRYNYNSIPVVMPKIKYPLYKNNAWQYSTYDLFHSSTGGETSNLGLYSVYVLADTIINNNTYYKLSDSPNDWIRYSENDNKLYMYYNNRDTVYTDFTAEDGAPTYQLQPNDHKPWYASVTTGKDTVLGVASNFVSLLGSGSGTSSIQKKYNSGLGHTYYRYFSYHTGSGGLNYELFLISARIFENGKLKDYSLPYYPEIEITPPKVITDPSLQFSFKVKHKYNTLVSTGKSLIYIDSVYLTGFYKKNESIIDNIKIIPENLAQTNVYMVDTTLSSDLLKQGYSFYFKVFAADKALIPKTTIKPDTGYFCISYSDPNSVNASDANIYSFGLKQNYPNPANPTSYISYSLPASARVKLTLYNSLGQIIKILDDSEKPAGNYKTIFNGCGLSSGIYFYRLTAGNYSATRKLILMK